MRLDFLFDEERLRRINNAIMGMLEKIRYYRVPGTHKAVMFLLGAWLSIEYKLGDSFIEEVWVKIGDIPKNYLAAILIVSFGSVLAAAICFTVWLEVAREWIYLALAVVFLLLVFSCPYVIFWMIWTSHKVITALIKILVSGPKGILPTIGFYLFVATGIVNLIFVYLDLRSK